MISLLTLGTIDLRHDQTELRSVLSQPKRLALFVYLATAQPRGFHSRDTLLAMFWPEADEEKARNALRQSLHYLRRSLGDDVVVGRGDWEVGVDAAKLSCDAAAFDDAIAAGDFERALSLYRGDFMPGFFVEGAPDAEEWLDNERRRRRLAAEDATRRLSTAERQRALEAVAPIRLPAPAVQAVPVAYGEVFPPKPPVAAKPADASSAKPFRRSARWLAYATLLIALAGAGFFTVRRMRAPAADTPIGTRPSIAVLPFVNMSADKENEYFSDGITEEILNALAQIDKLRVAARTSSFAYKGQSHDVRKIAEDLGVQVVLEGSVRKVGDQVRITAQLIDARNGYHLWSNTYDRELKDIFGAQQDIAQSISDALELQLGTTAPRAQAAPTNDAQAYDLYLRGRHSISLYSRESNDRAIAYLQQAIARDPRYALAYAVLARAYMTQAEFVPPRTVLPHAKRAALRALELDSTLVETRLALARVRQVYDRDWTASEQEIRRAIQLNARSGEAHYAYSEFLLQARRHADAERELRRTWEIRRAETPDTLVPAFKIQQHLSWGGFYLHAADSERALEHARAAAALDANNALVQWMIGTALQQMSRYQEAVAPMQRARARTDALAFLTHLGRAYALAGQRAQAQAVLDTLRIHESVRYVPKDQIALLQYSLGDTAQALVTLDKAIDDYHWFMPSTNGDPVWRGLWGNTGFEILMRKLGAPAT